MNQIEIEQLKLLKEIVPLILRDCNSSLVQSIMKAVDKNSIIPQWKAFNSTDYIVLTPFSDPITNLKIPNKHILKVEHVANEIYYVYSKSHKYIVRSAYNDLSKRVN